MELSELKSREQEIKAECSKSLRELHILYAKSNQLFNIGEVIDNGSSRILIDDVRVIGWFLGSPPCCMYHGVEYTKRGKPYKDGRRFGILPDSNTVKVDV